MSILAAGARYLPQLIGGIGAYKDSKPGKKQPAIPMPDEEALRQNKRRSAPRRSSRASTILTGTDDGLGG